MKRLFLFFPVFLISLFSVAQVQIDSVVVTDETCPGNCDGTLTVYTSNGAAPEMFDIGGAPQASNVFTGLCATSYTVTVTDALPSSDVTTATVASPTPLTYTVSTFNCSAYGVCDGQGSVLISGGTPPYSITFYDGGGTPIQVGTQTSIINLCAGNYSVSVTDNNSCAGTGPTGFNQTPFTITQPPPPPLSVNQVFQMPHCFPNCDGNTQLLVSGGVPPYTYSWGTWALGGFCDGDNAPAWIVTDAIGQQVSGPSLYMVSSIPTINNLVVNTNESCAGICDGEIQSNTTGGDPPYSYSIDNGANWQSSPVFSNLCPGNYTYRVIDTYGCGDYQSITVNGPSPINTNAAMVGNPTSIGGCDGAATGSASGGTPAYSYQWIGCAPTVFSSTPGSNPTINTLCAGDYQLVVTDANGCSDSSSCISIIDPPTGITKNTKAVTKVYPNPSTGIISVDLTDDMQLPVTIEVLNVYGKVVWEKTFTYKNDQSMDLSSLAKGVYFLNNTGLKIKKMIILE